MFFLHTQTEKKIFFEKKKCRSVDDEMLFLLLLFFLSRHPIFPAAVEHLLFITFRPAQLAAQALDRFLSFPSFFFAVALRNQILDSTYYYYYYILRKNSVDSFSLFFLEIFSNSQRVQAAPSFN
jgi:hypothetical protein